MRSVTSHGFARSRAARAAWLAAVLVLLLVAQRAVSVGAQTFTPQLTASTQSPAAGQAVTFTATSTVPTGTTYAAYGYVFNFGDGANSGFITTPTTTHSYTATGQFQANVSVCYAQTGTTNFGQTCPGFAVASNSVTITVGGTTGTGANSNIVVTTNGPYSGVAGRPISFGGYASTCSSCPAIAAYTWNFGDNTGTANGQQVQHTYANAGSYVATLTVNDANGGTNSASTQVSVTGSNGSGGTTPTGNGQASANGVTVNTGGPYTGSSGAPVSFNGTATTSNAGATIVSYVWSFGDGQSGSGQTTTHTYNSSGTFTVVLTATDSTGVAVSASTQATLQTGSRKITLAAGCANVSSTFPDSTSTGTIVQGVSPSSAVLSVWEFDAAAGRFHGYLPGATQASDLPTINRLDAFFICVNAAATFTEPSI